MHHILGNKVLEYDVDDRGVIVDEREIDRTVNHKPNIADWVKEHMVFWYDMSKPVDVYVPGVTYANQFTNDGGKIKYDSTINKCTITHTPTTANKNFWQVSCSPSNTISSFKLRVTGLPQGFSIESVIYSTKITSDGEYDIPEYKNSGTTTRYPGFYLAGDNVNDVDCNIVVEEIPIKQSVPTNEILKSNPYLQDFSGNNRPLKLNNFLFSAMSGVGGYEYNWLDSTLFITYLGGVRGNGTITSNTITINSVNVSSGVIESRVSSPSKKYKVKVTGITSDETLRYVVYGDTSLGENATIIFDMKKDGEYELPASTYSATYNMKWQVIAASYPHTCNITVEQIPLYPNALVTDGVDDYGKVQNFIPQSNYMMFIDTSVFGTSINEGLYSTKPISNNLGWMLLQINNNTKEIMFGNNSYANFKSTFDYKNRNIYVLTANSESMNLTVKDDNFTLNGTYNKTGNTMMLFRADSNSPNRFGKLAFYKAILFDAVPAKETDGFTEQDLIDYVLENLITK